jgi:hypothetical protein
VVVTEHDGTTRAGRRTRTVPVALRRVIEARDDGCRFPGCDSRAFHQVHHLMHFADGGATDRDNCLTLCAFHHRLVHEGGWRIVGDSAESRALVFISPNGRAISEVADAPVPCNAALPRASDIDAGTITTAEGGRIDVDLAITALCTMRARAAPDA